MMRDFLEKNHNKINEAQARDIVERCLKVLYYRDGRAYDKVKLFLTFKELILFAFNVLKFNL